MAYSSTEIDKVEYFIVLEGGTKKLILSKEDGDFIEVDVSDVFAFLSLDNLIVGSIVRDTNGAAISSGVVWPDNTPGIYTATIVSSAFPGAVDAYTITYGSPVTKTYTQPSVTRNASGAVINRPAIVVT